MAMKIRLAKKIENTRRTEGRYTEAQHDAASRRMDRTASEREAVAATAWMCDLLGPEGVAEVIKENYPGRALELLCEVEGVDRVLDGR